jgi:hypothetical protein
MKPISPSGSPNPTSTLTQYISQPPTTTQARHCPHGPALPCAPPAPPPASSPAPPSFLLPGDICSALCHRRSDLEPPPPDGGRSGRLQARSQAAAARLPPPHCRRSSFRVFILATVVLRRISRQGDALTSRCTLLLKRHLKNYVAIICFLITKGSFTHEPAWAAYLYFSVIL